MTGNIVESNFSFKTFIFRK